MPTPEPLAAMGRTGAASFPRPTCDGSAYRTGRETFAALGMAGTPVRTCDGTLTAAPLADDARTTNLDHSSGLLVTRRSSPSRDGRAEAGRGFWLYRPDATYGKVDILDLLGQEPGRTYSTHDQVAEGGGVDCARTMTPHGARVR